jgi:hypothetical protein
MTLLTLRVPAPSGFLEGAGFSVLPAPKQKGCSTSIRCFENRNSEGGTKPSDPSKNHEGSGTRQFKIVQNQAKSPGLQWMVHPPYRQRR